MFCVHCGKQVSDGSVFCSYCGNRIMYPENFSVSDTETLPDQSTEKRSSVSEPDSKKTSILKEESSERKTGMIKPAFLVALLIVGIGSALITWFVSNNKKVQQDYKDSAEYYSEAAEIENADEETIEDTALSDDEKKQQDYMRAWHLYIDHNYKEAADAFYALGDYRDSADYYSKASEKIGEQSSENDYNRAIDLIREGNYDEAFELFLSLGEDYERTWAFLDGTHNASLFGNPLYLSGSKESGYRVSYEPADKELPLDLDRTGSTGHYYDEESRCHVYYYDRYWNDDDYSPEWQFWYEDISPLFQHNGSGGWMVHTSQGWIVYSGVQKQWIDLPEEYYTDDIWYIIDEDYTGSYDSGEDASYQEEELSEEEILNNWVDTAGEALLFFDMLSLGMTTSTVRVEGHKIIYTTQYNVDVPKKEIKEGLETYLDSAGPMFRSGVDELKPYINDIRIRVEYRDYNGKVICDEEFS